MRERKEDGREETYENVMENDLALFYCGTELMNWVWLNPVLVNYFNIQSWSSIHFGGKLNGIACCREGGGGGAAV